MLRGKKDKANAYHAEYSPQLLCGRQEARGAARLTGWGSREHNVVEREQTYAHANSGDEQAGQQMPGRDLLPQHNSGEPNASDPACHNQGTEKWDDATVALSQRDCWTRACNHAKCIGGERESGSPATKVLMRGGSTENDPLPDFIEGIGSFALDPDLEH